MEDGGGDGDGEGSSRSAGVASCSSSSFKDEHLSKGISAFLETVGVLSSLKSSFWQSAETFTSSFNSFCPLSIFSLFFRSTGLFSSFTLSGLAVSALSVFESSRFASSPKDDRASLEVVILCSFFFSTLTPLFVSLGVLDASLLCLLPSSSFSPGCLASSPGFASSSSLTLLSLRSGLLSATSSSSLLSWKSSMALSSTASRREEKRRFGSG